MIRQIFTWYDLKKEKRPDLHFFSFFIFSSGDVKVDIAAYL